MEWQEARECVQSYCKNHDISLNHSQIKDMGNGMLTSYDSRFDLYPIELSWHKLFIMILRKENLNESMSKECFMIWNDICVE